MAANKSDIQFMAAESQWHFPPLYIVCFPRWSCLSVCLFKPDRLSPPLDIQLETINCTAFSVRWKMPRRHVSTITGYKVVTNCDFTLNNNTDDFLLLIFSSKHNELTWATQQLYRNRIFQIVRIFYFSSSFLHIVDISLTVRDKLHTVYIIDNYHSVILCWFACSHFCVMAFLLGTTHKFKENWRKPAIWNQKKKNTLQTREKENI